MKVIKRKAKKTYTGKDNKTYHYINYYLELDNGKRVGIKVFDVDDLKYLDAICIYEG